jgi:hypothetical protein
LTTIKPREKVVGEVDVESCLYYLHWEEEGLTGRGSAFDEEALGLEERTSKVREEVEESHAGIHRKPISSSEYGSEPVFGGSMPWDQPVTGLKTEKVADLPRRKPLGPRDLSADQGQMNSQSHPTNLRSTSGLEGVSRKKDPCSSAVSSSYLQSPQPDTVRSFYTIIRRDPASGNQANVGTIHGFHQPDSEDTSLWMNVMINNPGYVKITGAEEFQCRIEGKSRTKSVSSEMDDRATSLSMRKGGFSFTSPWGGRCEFVTGVGGRNLKVGYPLTDRETISSLIDTS